MKTEIYSIIQSLVVIHAVTLERFIQFKNSLFLVYTTGACLSSFTSIAGHLTQMLAAILQIPHLIFALVKWIDK